MLDGEGDQDQDRADEEGGVDAERQAFFKETKVRNGDLPGADRRLRRNHAFRM
jgi:hypothetical protein